jgi:hypothetical protein
MENNIEFLEARLKQLDEERETIQKLITIWKGRPPRPISPIVSGKSNSSSSSIRGRVVDAVIDLIHKVGRQVSNEEILVCVKEKGLSLGDTTNEQASLAAILSQEITKKSARLKRIARGMYDLK